MRTASKTNQSWCRMHPVCCIQSTYIMSIRIAQDMYSNLPHVLYAIVCTDVVILATQRLTQRSINTVLGTHACHYMHLVFLSRAASRCMISVRSVMQLSECFDTTVLYDWYTHIRMHHFVMCSVRFYASMRLHPIYAPRMPHNNASRSIAGAIFINSRCSRVSAYFEPCCIQAMSILFDICYAEMLCILLICSLCLVRDFAWFIMKRVVSFDAWKLRLHCRRWT